MLKQINYTILSILLAISYLGCSDFIEYDDPTIPDTLEIPPVGDRFQAMISVVNTINHMTRNTINEYKSYQAAASEDDEFPPVAPDKSLETFIDEADFLSRCRITKPSGRCPNQ